MINKRLKNPDYRKFFNLIQLVSFSNNMEYEEDDDAEDVRAGSFYTTPNGNNTSFSFFREDDEQYHINYQYQEVTDDTVKSVMKGLRIQSNGNRHSRIQENLQPTTPCNRFITSVFDKERFFVFYAIWNHVHK